MKIYIRIVMGGMMNMGKRTGRQWAILIGALALILWLSFVFGNSTLSKQESAEVSSSFMEAIEVVLRPIVEWVTGESASYDLLHKIVRKGAHLVEFAALSFILTVLLRLFCGTWKTHAIGYVLFISLLFGVADEFLQSFTGRGTSVRDVMLDFVGALIGVGIGIVIIELFEKIFRRRSK